MISELNLMRLHLEALFTVDAAGRLVSVNESGGGPAPRFFLGRTPEGNVWSVRHDLDPSLAATLHVLSGAEPIGLETEAAPGNRAPFLRELSRDGRVHRTWSGPAYSFSNELPGSAGTVVVTSANASLLRPFLEDWLPDVRDGIPVAVSIERGRAVSICSSVRMTERADEAGVETHPEFRGRGHAARAVAAWAGLVRGSNRVPLYSTSWENQPSRALAGKLGLIQFGSDFHVT